jgi:hypothetical protein
VHTCFRLVVSVMCCVVWCDVMCRITVELWSRSGSGNWCCRRFEIRLRFFILPEVCDRQSGVFEFFSLLRKIWLDSHLEIQCSKQWISSCKSTVSFPSPGFDIPLREKPISISYRSTCTIFLSPNPLTFASTIPNDLSI